MRAAGRLGSLLVLAALAGCRAPRADAQPKAVLQVEDWRAALASGWTLDSPAASTGIAHAEGGRLVVTGDPARAALLVGPEVSLDRSGPYLLSSEVTVRAGRLVLRIDDARGEVRAAQALPASPRPVPHLAAVPVSVTGGSRVVLAARPGDGPAAFTAGPLLLQDASGATLDQLAETALRLTPPGGQPWAPGLERARWGSWPRRYLPSLWPRGGLDLVGPLLFIGLLHFGFAAARRMLGEEERLALWALAPALALSALAVACLVLFRIAPARPAAAAAATVLGLAGLGLRLRSRTDAPSASRPFPRQLVPALGAIVLALAFTSVWAGAHLYGHEHENLYFHQPLAASMMRGNVPPVDFREPDQPLQYHWGEHLMSAALASLLNLAPAPAFLLLNTLGIAAACLLCTLLVFRAGHGAAAGLLSAALLVAGGAWLWLQHAPHVFDFASRFMRFRGLFAFSTVTHGSLLHGGLYEHMHTHSTLMAVVLLLAALFVLLALPRKPGWAASAWLGLLLGYLLLASETAFALGVVGLIALVALRALWRQPWRNAARTMLQAAPLAVLVGAAGGSLLAPWRRADSSVFAFQVLPNREHWGSLPGAWGGWWPLFSGATLLELGSFGLLLLPGLVWAVRRRDALLASLALMGVAGLSAATLVTVEPFPFNTYRFTNLAFVLGQPLVGCVLGGLLASRGRWAPVARTLAAWIAVASLGAWPLGTLAAGPGAPPAARPRSEDTSAVRWLVRNTEPRDMVVSLPLDSYAVLGSGQWTPVGYSFRDPRGWRRRAFAFADRPDLALWRGVGLRYLYVDFERATPAQREAAEGWLASGEARQAFAGLTGTALLELQHPDGSPSQR